MKKLTLYTVVLKEDPRISFTLTENKHQAFEYLSHKVRQDHMEHFKMGCECHDRDILDFESGREYSLKVLDPQEFYKYQIKQIKIPIAKAVAMMRVYCEYVPLGCSFEDVIELEALVSHLGDDFAQKVEEMMKELAEESGGELEDGK